MNRLVWRNIGRFVLLMLLQLLVLNNVYLGGYVMPMLYVLFILMLPTSVGRVPLRLTAFGTVWWSISWLGPWASMHWHAQWWL